MNITNGVVNIIDAWEIKKATTIQYMGCLKLHITRLDSYTRVVVNSLDDSLKIAEHLCAYPSYKESYVNNWLNSIMKDLYANIGKPLFHGYLYHA